MGLRAGNPAILTLLQWKRDIMKTIMNEKVTDRFSGVIPHLAILGILAAFKNGHHFKEGQLENDFPIIGPFAAPLDYTSHTFRWLIWGENAHRVFVMAILWLKRLSPQSINFHISLFTLHLQDIMLFEEHWSRFGDLCLSSDKAGNR